MLENYPLAVTQRTSNDPYMPPLLQLLLLLLLLMLWNPTSPIETNFSLLSMYRNLSFQHFSFLICRMYCVTYCHFSPPPSEPYFQFSLWNIYELDSILSGKQHLYFFTSQTFSTCARVRGYWWMKCYWIDEITIIATRVIKIMLLRYI